MRLCNSNTACKRACQTVGCCSGAGMDTVPLITLQSCKPVTEKQAKKIIRKFLEAQKITVESSLALTNRERISLVSEDVIDKLSTMMAVIEDQVRTKKESSTSAEKKSKKRKATDCSIETYVDEEISGLKHVVSLKKKKMKSAGVNLS